MSALLKKTETIDEPEGSLTWQEQLSACVDGELTQEQYQQMWKQMQSKSSGDELHAHWAMWSLVGEAMRNPSQAQLQASEPFVLNFRNRLAGEAVQQPPVEKKLKWLSMDAIARPGRDAANAAVLRWKMVAGFASIAAVAAIGWSSLSQVTQGPEAQLAEVKYQAPLNLAQEGRGPGLTLVSRNTSGLNMGGGAAPSAIDTGNGVMIRDARIDEVLSRQQNARANALQPSADFLRNTNLQGFGYQPSAIAE